MPIVVWAKNLLRFGALRGTLLDNDKSPALDRAAHQPGTGMEATSADARRNDRYATRQGAYVHRGQALGWGVIDAGPAKIESHVPIVAALVQQYRPGYAIEVWCPVNQVDLSVLQR
jgi:hypothetical protein